MSLTASRTPANGPDEASNSAAMSSSGRRMIQTVMSSKVRVP
ncbi:Uncharacterised protein [Mycobacteroides abscessus subsp. abscessus]|nr:Uncharacterised protein [Mycobacteroides abscessus subsp. abscessus]